MCSGGGRYHPYEYNGGGDRNDDDSDDDGEGGDGQHKRGQRGIQPDSLFSQAHMKITCKVGVV